MVHIITNRSRRERKPIQNTERFRTTPGQRQHELCKALSSQRKNLYRKDGMSRDGSTRHVASIPPEVVREVLRNDGREALGDDKYLIRRAEELGLPVRMGRSTRRRKRK